MEDRLSSWDQDPDISNTNLIFLGGSQLKKIEKLFLYIYIYVVLMIRYVQSLVGET